MKYLIISWLNVSYAVQLSIRKGSWLPFTQGIQVTGRSEWQGKEIETRIGGIQWSIQQDHRLLELDQGTAFVRFVRQASLNGIVDET